MAPRDVLSRPARRPDVVLSYGEQPDQVIDVHLPAPAGAGPAPLVVLLHGGFWHEEYDRTQIRPMADGLSAEGFVVASVEYRRTGGAGGWPATFDDAAAGVAAAPRQVRDAVPDRVKPGDAVLVGHSAGGHLALWAGLRDPAGISRIVGLAPAADLREVYRRELDVDGVVALLGGTPEEVPDRYDYGNAAALLPGPVPVTVVHGRLDEHVPVEMSRALRGVEYVELADVEHFALIDPRSPAWPQVLAAIRGARSTA